jgi:hypothetical protein
MKFEIYPKKGKIYYLAMVTLLGITTVLGSIKVGSLILAIVIGAYWFYRAACILINPTIYISGPDKSIEIYRKIGRYTISKKQFRLSKYHGIRNRIHWGHYKHCQTELIGSFGEYLPIRIELMSEKISPDAIEFKNHIAKHFNLGSSPDFEHA